MSCTPEHVILEILASSLLPFETVSSERLSNLFLKEELRKKEEQVCAPDPSKTDLLLTVKSYILGTRPRVQEDINMGFTVSCCKVPGKGGYRD